MSDLQTNNKLNEGLETRLRTGAEIFIDTLNELGFEYIFGHTGGTVIPVYVEINKRLKDGRKTPKVVMYRQEPGAGHAGEGYSKVSGRPSLVMVTSGPGATNLVTPISDAYADSVPVIFVTGQVGTDLIGNDAFQEVPITQMTNLRTKKNYLVKSTEEIGVTLRQAFYIASTGRPGPALIDICKDAFLKNSNNGYESDNPQGYRPNTTLDERVVDNMIEAFLNAKRPMIYAGGGIILSESSYFLRKFARKFDTPVGVTLMGLGTIDPKDRLSLGMLGMHGTVEANYAALNSDFILAIGARFDDRVVVSDFGRNAIIAHVDIDASEINKNRSVDYAINSNARDFFNYVLEDSEDRQNSLSEWHRQIEKWRKLNPKYDENSETIKPQKLIEEVSELTSGGAIVTTGVGQHQMWVAKHYDFIEPRSLITSGGLGTMGFGLPAAIGAYYANPKKTIICFDGDGSFQMNMQELATIVANKIPIKTFIFNNGFLGMPRQWEDMFSEGNHFESCLYRTIDCSPECTSRNPCRKLNPDFLNLKHVYPGLNTLRITKTSEIRPALDVVFNTPGPFVVDVWIDKFEDILPIIPPGKGIEEMMY
ncbi:MAG: biosynthetic-type acetolactate synthase large subunit [Nanoarchaeota archaeon]|nr:biosynthetic-type acetolactate synthase large subunit [Nanoarchaeota archaeon]